MAYYMVCSRVSNPMGSHWGVEFGDHDREAVAEEMEVIKRSDATIYPLKADRPKLKIIKANSAHRRDCDAALAKLNSGV